MVKLTDDYVTKQVEFKAAGIEVPNYLQEEVIKETEKKSNLGSFWWG